MSIPMKRLAGAALSLGIVFFACSAPADDATGVMIEQVLRMLNSAQSTLARDNPSRSDKDRALGEIRQAMDMLAGFRNRHR